MLSNGANPPPGVPGALRNRLLDGTLLVFLSDTHIGGVAGSEIFQSAAELTALLQDLNHHQGPVELVLAGDFLDLLRMGDPGHGETRPDLLPIPRHVAPLAARALVVVYAAYEGLAGLVHTLGGSFALRPVFLQLAYALALLLLAAAVVFLISRRMARQAAATQFTLFPGPAPRPQRYREDVAIRQLLEQDRPPPMAGAVTPLQIAVFVSGHTHAPLSRS